MKKVFICVCLLLGTLQSYSQTVPVAEHKNNDIKFFAEFSPFLAAFQLVSIGAGIEACNYQFGASFTKGNHHFSHGLNKITFENFGDLHFLHHQSEEIFVKRYFKKDRSALYLGLLFNLTHWEVQNHSEGINKNIIGKYLTTYAGYRWFPFRKQNDVFYIEPNVGISTRLNGSDFTQVGNQSFSFLQPPFELTPNMYMGARFKIGKKK